MEAQTTAVRREIFIETSVKAAWQAMVDPAERNRWDTHACEMDVRVGGHVSFNWGWGARSSGTIVELSPEQKIVIQDDDDESLTIWTLYAEGTGVRVSVEYTGLWIGDKGHVIADSMAFGTYQFIRNMKSVLEQDVDLREHFWRSWAGIAHTSIRPDHGSAVQGTLVCGVSKNSPAEEAGLLKGDIIKSANGHPVAIHDDLASIVFQLPVGAELVLQGSRGSDAMTWRLQLTDYPVPYIA